MIFSCPSCLFPNDSSRRDRTRDPQLACVACGHAWIEDMPEERKAPMKEPAPAPAVARNKTSEPEIRRLSIAARDARRHFADLRRQRKLALISWLALGLFAASPVACALAFPEQIVAAAPASLDFYRLIGREVNIYGLEIRDIDVQHFLMDGKKVIAVRGQLTNTSSELRRIPWLRFGLRGQDKEEVYHWVLNTEARPLKPGDSTSFVTRLASPPSSAEHLEIRFAHIDEIGSNDGL